MTTVVMELRAPKFKKDQRVDYRGETATIIGVKLKKNDFLYTMRLDSGKKMKAYEGELKESE